MASDRDGPMRQEWRVLDGLPTSVLLRLLSELLSKKKCSPRMDGGSLECDWPLPQGRRVVLSVRATGTTLIAEGRLVQAVERSPLVPVMIGAPLIVGAIWAIEQQRLGSGHHPLSSAVAGIAVIAILAIAIRAAFRSDQAAGAADHLFQCVRTGIDALVRQMHSHYSGPLLVDDPTTAEVRISPLLVDRMSRPAKPPAEIPPELRPRPELRQVTRGILAARPWCDHAFRQALCSGDAEQVTQRFTDEVRRALSASDAYAAHILCRRNITLPSQLVAAITMLTLPTPTRHTEVAQYAYVHPLGAPYAASCRVFIVERGCDAARDPLRAWAFAELVPQDSTTSRYVLWHMFDVEPSLDQVIELIRIRLDREGLPPIEAASPG